MKRITLIFLALLGVVAANAQLTSRSFEDVANGNNICLQWAAQPGLLYTGSTNGEINKYDVAGGTNTLFKTLGTDKVYSLAADRAGKLYATSNETGYIINNDEVLALTGHSYKVDDIAVSSVNGLIATASRDNSVIIWNADGSRQKILKGHDEDVYAVCFSPDGELVASCSKDKTVKIWESVSGRLVKSFASATTEISDLAFSNDGTRLFAAGNAGVIICWNTKDWAKLFTLEALPAAIKKIGLSRDDQFLVAAGEMPKLTLFDLRTNTKETLETTLSTIDVQFSPDGKALAALTTTGQVMVWDITSRKIGEQKFPVSDKKAILAVSALQITERNNNGIIEPGDNAEVKFTLSNTGNGRAYDVNLLLAVNGNVQGLGIKNKIFIGELEPGATITKYIPLDFGKNITSGNANVQVYATAANHIETEKQSASFQTKGTGSMSYILVSEPTFTTPEGFVKKGLPVTMKYRLKNIGPEPAIHANASFTLPEHVIAVNKLFVTYPYINGNTTIEDSLMFYADNSFAGGNIEIKMALANVTTGQEVSVFNVQIGQDLRPKIDTPKPAAPAVAPQQGNGSTAVPANADPGEGTFTVDAEIPTAAKSENRIALIIGNENYTEYNTKIAFAGNDARIFKEYAQRLLGVEQDNLFYLQDATAADVKSAIEKVKKLASIMNGKAEIIVYYSGATFVDDYFRDEYLLPVDLRSNKLDDYYTLQNILGTLSDPKHTSITAYVDGTRLFDNRLKPATTGKTPRSFYLYGNTRLLKATTGSQSAAASEKLKHGLFTYYMLKKYKLDKEVTDISKLAAYTEEQVKLACFRMGLPEQLTEFKSSR